jgi:hypothetical protein
MSHTGGVASDEEVASPVWQGHHVPLERPDRAVPAAPRMT